ncbi:MAG: alginate lyase family protein [Acidobacteria bacterium]|nr:alginate lyase family protein [Acidobacteriota bacterium]
MALPAAAQSLPAHPRLLFNAEGVARLKQRVQRTEWSARWKNFLGGVGAAMSKPVELPPRPANWWHWYVCPRHGVRLTTGKPIGPWQWEHICPVDGEILRGDPTRPDRDYDAIVTSNIQDGYAREARNAGIAYAVTGEARYAARVREILLAYAAKYLSYPLHNTRGQARIGGGRVTSQTLDESVWLIPLAQGADLVWNTLGEDDRRAIADKLFLPAARDVILAHRMGIHNIQNWKNSAVGLTGFLLGDEALIRAAIDDPDRGYRQQMARGVQPDGVWFEGAWGYHFYTMSAVWPLTEAARNSGIDLYGDPYKRMFLAPVNLAMPNGFLPAFNDSTEVNIHNDLYELAYARYHDPLLLAGIDRARRGSDYALWFGDDTLPAPASAPLGSRNFTVSGYAILERGEGPRTTWLCLKYGPHGGGHGHPDKNNFILFANGKVLFPDPGTRPYGSPLHTEWDRATIAHNTLVVDGANQAEATGRSLAFGTDNGADYSMTDAGPIYPGVRFVRTAVLLNEKLILFVDRVTADREHTFDLAVHVAGKWTSSAGDAVEVAYPHVRDARRVASSGDTRLAWDGGAIVLAGNEPGEAIAATGPGKSTEDRVPMAIFRRKGTRTEYVWAVALDGAAVALTHGAEGIGVESAGAKWNVQVDVEKGQVRVK